MPTSELEWIIVHIGLGYFLVMPALSGAIYSELQKRNIKIIKMMNIISYSFYIFGFVGVMPLVLRQAKINNAFGLKYSFALAFGIVMGIIFVLLAIKYLKEIVSVEKSN